MKKIIRSMIIIVICIIVVIAILLAVNEDKNYNQRSVIKEEDFSINSNDFQKVESKNDYIDISQCVYRYFSYIREANAVSLIELLDGDYVKENNISESNVFKHTYECKERILYHFIKDMRVKYNLNITQYIIECNVSDDNEEKSIFLIVSVDNSKMSFCILPVNEKYENIDRIQLNNEPKSINENKNNKLIHNSVDDEEMCKFLLNDYINKAVHFPKEAYNFLDEEYKSKRFPEYKDFQKYIEYNKKRLQASILDDIKQLSDFKDEEKYIQYLGGLDRVQLDKYLVERDENVKRYICMDKNECYYIFNEKKLMDFKLVLDTYTIPSEKFKKTYNKGNEQLKMQLNIDKFIKMINNKDYKNAYSVLDEGFKEKYFQDEMSFEIFVKDRFYEFNQVSFGKFRNEGQIFIYEVTITDIKNLNTKGNLKFNIIMKLLDNYDFIVSFGNT